MGLCGLGTIRLTVFWANSGSGFGDEGFGIRCLPLAVYGKFGLRRFWGNRFRSLGIIRLAIAAYKKWIEASGLRG